MANSFDVHEYYEYQLLERIEQAPTMTRRQASEVLGVSIKLAHLMVYRLIEKGLVHVHRHHHRRWDYFLTPKGVAQKARLTAEFLDFSLHFFRQARRESAQRCRELAEAGVRRVAFLGAADLAEIVYLGVKEWHLELAAVYAEGKKEFMGVPVQPLSALPACDAPAILVCLYDVRQPLSSSYLPDGIARSPRMRWVFEAPEPPPEAPAAPTRPIAPPETPSA